MGESKTIVHVTHEAAGKIGGIGAVLHGLCTCKTYLEATERTIIVGPLFTVDIPVAERLGEDADVLYSSLDKIERTNYTQSFKMIESFYNVGIVYGIKTFEDKHTGVKSQVEVLLVNVKSAYPGPVNALKKVLYEKFGIKSNLYEHIWEYEEYVRLAPVTLAILKEIGALHDATTIIAHEFMGMPTALAATLSPNCNCKTVFYAHEVAAIRRIVEEHPGHDTMFYNALAQGHSKKLYLSDIFGDQSDYFKHPLVEASRHCDGIFAVGDYVVKELKFLAPEFEQANINIVYNGIPAYNISLEDKLKSREKLLKYSENLLAYKPDFVFTHVTRLVPSKGLWRDLNVLHTIEQEFRKLNKTAVLFVISTETAQKSTTEIQRMEAEYNWPVAHHDGWPDLSGGESKYYEQVQTFNARSRNIKVVFINQFGFSRKACGSKMPRDTEFMDIRKGSDLEFGLSVYEPFGIAQLEALTFGGICVINQVCGCSGFINDVTGNQSVKNVIVPDYTDISSYHSGHLENILEIDLSLCHKIEHIISKKIALEIVQQLPQNEKEMDALLKSGHDIAEHMSWDVVVQNYFLPAMQNLQQKRPAVNCA